jgi:hypothetical protein
VSVGLSAERGGSVASCFPDVLVTSHLQFLAAICREIQCLCEPCSVSAWGTALGCDGEVSFGVVDHLEGYVSRCPAHSDSSAENDEHNELFGTIDLINHWKLTGPFGSGIRSGDAVWPIVTRRQLRTCSAWQQSMQHAFKRSEAVKQSVVATASTAYLLKELQS